MTPRRPDDAPREGMDAFESALQARRRLLPQLDEYDGAEPAPELDRLVLARARAALQPAATAQRRHGAPRWGVPLALAATLLLSFGLVMQLDPARNDTVLPPAPSAGSAAAPEAARQDEAAVGALQVPQSPSPPGPAAMTAEPAAPSARARSGAPAPPAAPAAAATATAAAAPAAAGAPAAPDTFASTAAAVADDAPQARRLEESAADAMAARKAAPAAPAEAAARTATTAAADATGAADAGAPAAPPLIPRDDPQRWLAAIEALQRAGKFAAARAELVEFRQRHPDMPLPETLHGLR